MYPHDEDEALAIVAQMFPDNTQGVITPAMARAGLAGIIARTKNQPPNLSPGADLRVRFETAAQLLGGGGPGAGNCLEEADDAHFCLGMLAWVEFPAGPGHGVTFRLMYDGNPARTPTDSGVHAYRTGHMVGGDRLQAQWVRLDDPIAGVPTYGQLQNLAGGHSFTIGEPVRDFAGTNAEYFFAAKLAGPLPAPTSANGDVNWRRIAPEAVAVAPYQVITVAVAQALAATDTAIQPVAYRILRGSAGSPAARRGDVVVQGIAATPATTANDGDVPACFATEALWLNPVTGQWEPKRYDVATDAVSASRIDDAETDLDALFSKTAAVDSALQGLATGKVEAWQPGPAYANRRYLVIDGVRDGLYQPKTNLANSQSVSLTNYTRLADFRYLPASDHQALLTALTTRVAALETTVAGLPQTADMRQGTWNVVDNVPNLLQLAASGALVKGRYFVVENNALAVTASVDTPAPTTNPNVYLHSIVGVAAGAAVTGGGLPAGVTVQSVQAGSQSIVLSQAVTLAAGMALTFTPQFAGVRDGLYAGDEVYYQAPGWRLRPGVARLLATPGSGPVPGPVSTVLQIRSDSTNRTRTLRLDETLQLVAATAKASNNGQAVTFQVNKYVGSSFQGGAVRATIAAAQADYDALTPAEKTAGAELLINTVPLDAAAVAFISVELIYG